MHAVIVPRRSCLTDCVFVKLINSLIHSFNSQDDAVFTEKADKLYLMALNWQSLVARVGRGRACRRARNDAQTRARAWITVAVAKGESCNAATDRTDRQVTAARGCLLPHQFRVLCDDEPVLGWIVNYHRQKSNNILPQHWPLMLNFPIYICLNPLKPSVIRRLHFKCSAP